MRDTGFFTMDFTHKIAGCTNLSLAKAECLQKIDEKTTARPENVLKAKRMVNAATSLNRLVIALGNFILAQESQKLKVIR